MRSVKSLLHVIESGRLGSGLDLPEVFLNSVCEVQQAIKALEPAAPPSCPNMEGPLEAEQEPQESAVSQQEGHGRTRTASQVFKGSPASRAFWEDDDGMAEEAADPMAELDDVDVDDV